jgi:hypothetical protein
MFTDSSIEDYDNECPLTAARGMVVGWAISTGLRGGIAWVAAQLAGM